MPLPRPLKGSPEPHFSFAGLKAAVARMAPDHAAVDVAASFQQAVVDCLIDRTRRALRHAAGATALVVAGGVAANGAVRAALQALAAEQGLRFVAPPGWLCTDNAAMIAWAAIERLRAGIPDDPADLTARPRWPLDQSRPALIGSGKKGAKA